MIKENCTNSELQVSVKARKPPRFKAGSDLSSRVNRVDVDFNEEQHEDHDLIEVKITLSEESCAASEIES